VKDGETPEIIAHKYYGDSKRHWIVMFSNYIIDPYFDFPLSQTNFENFVANKYGSSIIAMDTLHHVDLVIKTTNLYNGSSYVKEEREWASAYYVDPSTDNLTERTLPTLASPIITIDSITKVLADGTSCTIEQYLHAISCYDYENELNEKKRKIQLIDKIYAPTLEKEFKNLVSK